MRRSRQRGAKRELLLERVEGGEAIFDDPQAVAFARAYARIKDAEKRAFLEWFVNALAEGEQT